MPFSPPGAAGKDPELPLHGLQQGRKRGAGHLLQHPSGQIGTSKDEDTVKKTRKDSVFSYAAESAYPAVKNLKIDLVFEA